MSNIQFFLPAHLPKVESSTEESTMNTSKTSNNAITAAIATLTVAAGMFIASVSNAATPAPSSTATSAPAKTATLAPAAATAKSGALDNATVNNWKRLTNTAPAMVA